MKAGITGIAREKDPAASRGKQPTAPESAVAIQWTSRRSVLRGETEKLPRTVGDELSPSEFHNPAEPPSLDERPKAQRTADKSRARKLLEAGAVAMIEVGVAEDHKVGSGAYFEAERRRATAAEARNGPGYAVLSEERIGEDRESIELKKKSRMTKPSSHDALRWRIA
jgi:hypothetical protein